MDNFWTIYGPFEISVVLGPTIWGTSKNLPAIFKREINERSMKRKSVKGICSRQHLGKQWVFYRFKKEMA